MYNPGKNNRLLKSLSKCKENIRSSEKLLLPCPRNVKKFMLSCNWIKLTKLCYLVTGSSSRNCSLPTKFLRYRARDVGGHGNLCCRPEVYGIDTKRLNWNFKPLGGGGGLPHMAHTSSTSSQNISIGHVIPTAPSRLLYHNRGRVS